jgi:phosphomannomutase
LTLIKSISGTRGTIGGKVGQNLTAQDLASSTSGYAQWLLNRSDNKTVVIGRDARISGEVVSQIVIATLRMMGLSVIDLGLSTTPTVEMTVASEKAAGGIVLTASHNPKQWNALKFLNEKGEFISAEDGAEILRLIDENLIEFAQINNLGELKTKENTIQEHIDAILNVDLVKVDAIKAAKMKVVVDCINSTGSISIVPLLKQLGCEVITINDDLTGQFAHNPEPLPENLLELSKAVLYHRANLGVAVDPDVDRLVIVNEDGEMFGEEYTLVAVSDYVLKHRKGNTVSNLSSTIALKIVTEKHGGQYTPAAVGEVNVVTKMKETNAIIGGEGNGGVIFPELHYGRDALIGIALFISHLVEYGKPCSFLRRSYPNYYISKNKINLDESINLPEILSKLAEKYANQELIQIDGLKILFDGDNWIHLRGSNTEPIMRIYAESDSEVRANSLAEKIKIDISNIAKDMAKEN